MSDTRMPAVVSYVRDDEERCLTSYVGVEGNGWGQGFGGLVLDPPSLADWKASLCELFEVSKVEDIVGRNCIVLYNWPTYGEDIEGLEVDGRRFTMTDFRLKHWPTRTTSRLEQRRDDIIRDIDYHARRVREQVQALGKVEVGYVEWSTRMTSSPPSSEEK